MSSPFNVDLGLQTGHVSTFQDLVAQTMSNNNMLKGTAESALVANQGKMSQAFQVWMEQLITHATINNQKLDAISQALGFGIKSAGGTDEGNAAPFQAGHLL
jgi:uncharacterized protein YukE